MPKLLVDSDDHASPRKRRTSIPHSPFQKLIDGRRIELNLSTRELARLISKHPGAKVDQSTLWVWLHTANGYPATKAWRHAHAVAMAKALNLTVDAILTALDQSRMIYTGRNEVTPAPAMDVLKQLEDILTRRKGVYVRRTAMLRLIQLLRLGAEAPPRPLLKEPSSGPRKRPAKGA